MIYQPVYGPFFLASRAVMLYQSQESLRRDWIVHVGRIALKHFKGFL